MTTSLNLDELLTLKLKIDVEIEKAKEKEPLGDGKAVFLSDGTEEDYQEHDRNVNKGWGPFIKKALNLEKKHESN